MDNEEDRTLIYRLREGEEAAYRELARNLGTKLERWLMLKGYSQADASEISGEVTLEVFNRLHKFDAPEMEDVAIADAVTGHDLSPFNSQIVCLRA